MQGPLPVERIEVMVTSIPAHDAHPDGVRWYSRHSHQLLVKVHSEGMYGLGEGFAYGAPKAVLEVIEAALGSVLLGKDAACIGDRVQEMARATRICGRSGIAAFAVAALEIALWDLLGKAKGQPVHELLGGARRTMLPAYISLPRYESAAAAARESARVAAQGFRSIKLHQTEVLPVLEARREIGDAVSLMLDANCAWSEQDAVSMARALEPAHLAWLEEPVWPPEDYRTIARVRASTRIPVSLGENEYSLAGFDRCLTDEAADVLQPSVAKLGLLAMAQVASRAQQAGVPVIPHSFYFGPGLAATLHFVATLPGDSPMEFPLGDVPLLKEPLAARDGTVAVPSVPGLGIELNEEMVSRHLVARREIYAT